MTQFLNNMPYFNCQENVNNLNLPTNLYIPLAHSTQCNVLAYLDSHISKTTLHDVAFDSNSIPLIVDTGATGAFSNKKSDFIKFNPLQGEVRGLGTLQIKGTGTVRYRVQTIYNKIITIEIQDALYVPDLPVHLLSPQQLAQQLKHQNINFDCSVRNEIIRLEIGTDIISVPYHSQSNLPILHTVADATKADKYIQTHLCSWNAAYLLDSQPHSGPPLKLIQLDKRGEVIIPDEDQDPATVAKDSFKDQLQKQIAQRTPSCVPIQLPVGTESSNTTPEITFNNLDNVQKLLLHYHQ